MNDERRRTRLAVIGDVAGHNLPLQRELRRLGVDVEAAVIPDELIVVQVGDLVHRGPDSPGVVALVDRLITNNAGRWVQLAGNHEAQYLFPPRFQWNERLPQGTVDTIRSWWEKGTMRLAAAFHTEGQTVRVRGGDRTVVGAGPLLITHAGLCVGLHRRLGSPENPAAIARTLNEERFEKTAPAWRDGAMLGGPARSDAGVVWAEATTELHLPWLHAPDRPSFHQAHGHTSPFNHRLSRWWPQAAELVGHAHVDPNRRHVRTDLGTMTLWAVDPCHGRTPTKPWQALELDLTASTWNW